VARVAADPGLTRRLAVALGVVAALGIAGLILFDGVLSPLSR
jgi:hypothetical protein